MAEIWEKQNFDTPRSYNHFCIYRDMGIQRTLQKVREQLGKPPKYIRSLEYASVKYRWVERANAYDDYIEEEARKENEAEIKEMKKRHILQARLMQNKVIERMQNLNPQEMTSQDCVRMYDVAVKVERLSRGCEDNKIEVNNKVIVDTKEAIERKKLENLTEEELEELERLTEKMNGAESE